jgi:hypothetical protein
MSIARRILAIDDEEFPAMRFAPFAAEHGSGVQRTRRVRAASDDVSGASTIVHIVGET